MPLGEAMRTVVGYLKSENKQQKIIFVAPVKPERLRSGKISMSAHELEYDGAKKSHIFANIVIPDPLGDQGLAITDFTLAVQARMDNTHSNRTACYVDRTDEKKNGFTFISRSKKAGHIMRVIRTDFAGTTILFDSDNH